MRERNIKFNPKKYLGFAAVLLLALALFASGTGLAGLNTNTVEPYVYASDYDSGSGVVELPNADSNGNLLVPAVKGQTYTYSFLNGSGLSEAYKNATHKYTDGGFKDDDYSNSNIWASVVDVKEDDGQGLYFYTYLQLPYGLTYPSAKIKVQLKYDLYDLNNVSSLTASVTTLKVLPTSDYKMEAGEATGAVRSSTSSGETEWSNSINLTSTKYLQIKFFAKASGEVKYTSRTKMGIRNLELRIQVEGDSNAPTITKWNGSSAANIQYVDSSTEETLFKTMYGGLVTDRTVYGHNIIEGDSRDSEIDNKFGSYQNIDSKTVSFVVYDQLMGIKSVKLNGYILTADKTKEELQAIMAADSTVDLTGIKSISVKKFGYTSAAKESAGEGVFRGMQVTIVFDLLDKNGIEIPDYKSYTLEAVDNGESTNKTIIKMGGIDRTLPELPQISVITATDNTDNYGREWFSKSAVKFKAAISVADPMKNVEYFYTLKRYDLEGRLVETVAENAVFKVSAGSASIPNELSKLVSGVYHISYKAVDKAGNQVSSESDTLFYVDNVAPTFNYSIKYAGQTTEYVTGVWSNQAVEILFEDVSSFSGYTAEYRMDNGLWTALPADTQKIVIDGESGNVDSLFSFRVTSNSGLVSESKSTANNIMVDTTPPNMPFSLMLNEYNANSYGYGGTSSLSINISIQGGIDKELVYGSLFTYKYVVHYDGSLVGDVQTATLNEGRSGKAVLNLYEYGVDFGESEYLLREVEMWCVDQAGHESAKINYTVKLIRPEIFIKFNKLTDSKTFDGTANAVKLIDIELYDRNGVLLSENTSSALFIKQYDLSAKQEFSFDYNLSAANEKVYINGVGYSASKDGLKNSGLDFVSYDSDSKIMVLKSQSGGKFTIANFNVVYSPVFSDENVGAGKEISLALLAGGDYVEIQNVDSSVYNIYGLIGDSNVDLNEAGAVIASGDITPATLAAFVTLNANGTLQAMRAPDKIYDGTDFVNFSLTSNVLVSLDQIEGEGWRDLMWDADLSFADVNAASNVAVNVNNFRLSGLGADNYKVVDINGIETQSFVLYADIQARKLIVDTDATSALDKVYDRSREAEIEPLVLKGVNEDNEILPDSNLFFTCHAEFESYAVGSNKKVVITSVTIDGDDRNNYVFDKTTQPTATLYASISARPAVLSRLKAKSKVYDGTLAATLDSYALTGLLPADDTLGAVALGAGEGVFESKDAGLRFATLKGLYLYGVSAVNYVLTDADGNAITQANTTDASLISKLIIEISATADGKVYDGKPYVDNLTLSLSGVLSGDSLYVGSLVDNYDNAAVNKRAYFMLNGARVPVELFLTAFGNINSSTTESTVNAVFSRFVKYDEDLHSGLTRYSVDFSNSTMAAFYVLNSEGYYEIFDESKHNTQATRFTVNNYSEDANGEYVLETLLFNEDGSPNTNYLIAASRIDTQAKLYTTAKALITRKSASVQVVALLATDKNNNVIYMDADGYIYIKSGNAYNKYDASGTLTATVADADMTGNAVRITDVEYGGYMLLNNMYIQRGADKYLLKYDGGIYTTVDSFTAEGSTVRSYSYLVGETIYINGSPYVIGEACDIEGVEFVGIQRDKAVFRFGAGTYSVRGQQLSAFNNTVITNNLKSQSYVGDYAVTVERVINDNYNFTSLSGLAIKVTPALLKVFISKTYVASYGEALSLSAFRLEYSGFRNRDTASTLFRVDTPVIQVYKNGSPVNVVPENKLNTGSYDFEFILPELENYEYAILFDIDENGNPVYAVEQREISGTEKTVVTKYAALKISKATLTGVRFDDATVIYSGAAVAFDATAYPQNAQAIYTYYRYDESGALVEVSRADLVNAGYYKADVTITAGDGVTDYGYEDYQTSAYLIIKKADISLFLRGSKSVIYAPKIKLEADTAVMTPDSSVTAISADDIVYQYSNYSGFTALIQKIPDAAGIYYARAYFAGNENYNAAYSNTVSLTIQPFAIPVSLTKGTDYIYDEYFGADGDELTDEKGNELYKGLEFSVSDYAESYAKYVQVEYLDLSGKKPVWTTTAPDEAGSYSFRITSKNSNFTIICDRLTGIFTLGAKAIGALDSDGENYTQSQNAMVELISGSLPASSDSKTLYYLRRYYYTNQSTLFTSFNDYVGAAESVLGGKYELANLYDINLYQGTVKSKNEDGSYNISKETKATFSGQIRLKIAQNTLPEGAKAVLIGSNGSITYLKSTYENGYINIITDSLGYIGIVVPQETTNWPLIILAAVGGALLLIVIAVLSVASSVSKNKKRLAYAIALSSRNKGIGNRLNATGGETHDKVGAQMQQEGQAAGNDSYVNYDYGDYNADDYQNDAEYTDDNAYYGSVDDGYDDSADGYDDSDGNK